MPAKTVLEIVVYVDHNSTHVKNVNKALLVEGVAVIYDFSNNEFSPQSWSLYIQKTEDKDYPDPLVPLTISVIVAFVVVILCVQKLRKPYLLLESLR